MYKDCQNWPLHKGVDQIGPSSYLYYSLYYALCTFFVCCLLFSPITAEYLRGEFLTGPAASGLYSIISVSEIIKLGKVVKFFFPLFVSLLAKVS